MGDCRQSSNETPGQGSGQGFSSPLLGGNWNDHVITVSTTGIVPSPEIRIYIFNGPFVIHENYFQLRFDIALANTYLSLAPQPYSYVGNNGLTHPYASPFGYNYNPTNTGMIWMPTPLPLGTFPPIAPTPSPGTALQPMGARPPNWGMNAFIQSGVSFSQPEPPGTVWPHYPTQPHSWERWDNWDYQDQRQNWDDRSPPSGTYSWISVVGTSEESSEDDENEEDDDGVDGDEDDETDMEASNCDSEESNHQVEDGPVEAAPEVPVPESSNNSEAEEEARAREGREHFFKLLEPLGIVRPNE